MYKTNLWKRIAVFSMTAALIFTSIGVIPAKKATAAEIEDGGQGHLYTNFVTIQYEDLEVGKSYLFSPARYSDDAAVFQAPTGSSFVRLDVKGAYDSGNNAHDYDKGRELYSGEFSGLDHGVYKGNQKIKKYRCQTFGKVTPTDMVMGGVAVLEQGDGFDHCSGGTIYYAATQPAGANRDPFNTVNQEGWYYSCNGGGVKYSGPFYIITYDTYTYGPENLEVTVSDTFKSIGSTPVKTVTQDELDVKINVNGKTYTAAECTIDPRNNTISETDNTVTLKLGNGDDTVYKTVELPQYTYVPQFTADDVTVKTSDSWSFEGETRYTKTVTTDDLNVTVNINGTEYPINAFSVDPNNNTIGANDEDNDVTILIPSSYGTVSKTVTLPGFIHTFSTPIVKNAAKASNAVGNIGGIKKLKEKSAQGGASVLDYQGVTDADREYVENGANINIYLTAEEGDRNSVGNKRLAKEVEEDEKTFGMALDLNVFKDIIKTTGETTSTQLRELIDTIDVEIALPEEHQGKDGYVIYRYHVKPNSSDVEVETISNRRNSNGEYLTISEDGTKLILTVKKFSDYVLAYDPGSQGTNGEATNAENAGNQNTTDSVAPTSAIKTASVPKTTKVTNNTTNKKSVTVASVDDVKQDLGTENTELMSAKSPKTGDVFPVIPMMALVFWALGIIGLIKSRKHA